MTDNSSDSEYAVDVDLGDNGGLVWGGVPIAVTWGSDRNGGPRRAVPRMEFWEKTEIGLFFAMKPPYFVKFRPPI